MPDYGDGTRTDACGTTGCVRSGRRSAVAKGIALAASERRATGEPAAPEGDVSMKRPLRALLVEGSTEDAARLVRELEGAGFNVTFERVDTAEGVRGALDKGGWELIVSSDTLPQFKGTDVLEMCRERDLEASFIFVSGSADEEAALATMKAGAQDCVTKGNLAR